MFLLSTQGMFGVSWYPHFFYFNLFEPKILAQDEGDEDDGTLDISVAGPTFRLQDDGSWWMLMLRAFQQEWSSILGGSPTLQVYPWLGNPFQVGFSHLWLGYCISPVTKRDDPPSMPSYFDKTCPMWGQEYFSALRTVPWTQWEGWWCFDVSNHHVRPERSGRSARCLTADILVAASCWLWHYANSRVLTEPHELQ